MCDTNTNIPESVHKEEVVMGKPILEAKAVNKEYNQRYVLKNVDVSIDGGEFIAILGHSGSGKSTMLNIFSSILTPTSGQMLYHGQDITQLPENKLAELRREKIGLVFQHYMLLPNLNVRENIALGKKKSGENINLDGLCKLLGIQNLLDSYPYQLSGGEQQRACIARAVIKKPEILFCDEATGALDKDNSINIVTLLHKIKGEYGTTIFFTTHNREIAKTADRVLVLEDGHIIEDYVNQEKLAPEEMKWGI